jgi:hypothetical protein
MIARYGTYGVLSDEKAIEAANQGLAFSEIH